MTDTTKLRELHAKATTPNEWGGPFDMQDATNKLLRALPTLLAKSDRADALEAELAGLTAQYEERTAYTIVHRGQALVCSDAMRGAYSDEHHRANRADAALAHKVSDEVKAAYGRSKLLALRKDLMTAWAAFLV